jgi:hypothetical protein
MQRTFERLRGEFLEMPGLRLTTQQVQRLCGIDLRMCQAALDALVDARFLCVKSDGRYARLTDGVVSHRQSSPDDRPAIGVPRASDHRSRPTAA